MSNTHLNLIEYEFSKTLKEYGFNYHTEFYFDNENKEIPVRGDYAGYNEQPDKIASPAGYMVRQWLRNEYNIDIFVCRLSNITIPNLGYGFIVYTLDEPTPIVNTIPYETYEDAEIAGIKYIFNELLNHEGQEESTAGEE